MHLYNLTLVDCNKLLPPQPAIGFLDGETHVERKSTTTSRTNKATYLTSELQSHLLSFVQFGMCSQLLERAQGLVRLCRNINVLQIAENWNVPGNLFGFVRLNCSMGLLLFYIMGLFDHISIFNKEITPLSYLSFPVPVYTPSTT